MSSPSRSVCSSSVRQRGALLPQADQFPSFHCRLELMQSSECLRRSRIMTTTTTIPSSCTHGHRHPERRVNKTPWLGFADTKLSGVPALSPKTDLNPVANARLAGCHVHRRPYTYIQPHTTPRSKKSSWIVDVDTNPFIGLKRGWAATLEQPCALSANRNSTATTVQQKSKQPLEIDVRPSNTVSDWRKDK